MRAQIIDLSFLELDFGLASVEPEQDTHRRNFRCGATEDSKESCAPYINMMPDESEGEEPSPLNLRGFECTERPRLPMSARTAWRTVLVRK